MNADDYRAHLLKQAEAAKQNRKKLPKYRNTRTEVDGITLDSKHEAARYRELRLLERAGLIAGLRVQVPYELAPSVRFSDEARAKPALRYVADFVYLDKKTGKTVVEDAKGVVTPEYRAKRHLMLHLFGIEVQEVFARGKKKSVVRAKKKLPGTKVSRMVLSHKGL